MRMLLLCFVILITSIQLFAQPQPCGPTPIMANTCDGACVICDIDGYVGTNNLQAGGQDIGNIFCSTPNDMHFMAFIAGSMSLRIRIDVSNCQTMGGGWRSLDIGFYESLNCDDFTPITACKEDLENGDFFVFNTTQDLVIGQHYYLVMDGSFGSICDWSFTVLDGSTKVFPLTNSGTIDHVEETCPGILTTITTVLNENGAAIFDWTIDGVVVDDFSKKIDHEFTEEGTYEICVEASNACERAPIVCDSIRVRVPEVLNVVELLCDGECYEANGNMYCQSGLFQEVIQLTNGCDSIINLDITVLPQAQEQVNVWICNSDAFLIGTTPYTVTGTYADTILTADACDSIVMLELLTIECEIIGTPDEVPAICNGTATGTLIFSVDQGTPPLTYVYTSLIDPNNTGTGTTNLLVNNEIPNIVAGNYQIYITDDFGNDAVVLQDVTEPTVITGQLLPSDYNGFNVSCYFNNGSPGDDGQLTANIEGGEPPYSYLWSDGQTTQTAIGLTYQNYSVIVTDDVGCTFTLDYTLTSAPEITPSVLFSDPTCDGFETGYIAIESTSGGTAPYLYGLSTTPLTSDTLYSDLPGGDYVLQISDANNCNITLDSMLVTPDIPVISFAEDKIIDLCDSIILRPQLNDSELTDISWSTIESGDLSLSCGDCLTPYASPANLTTYSLSVTSIDDCTASNSISVNVTKRRRVYVPNVFSTSAQGEDSRFMIFSGCEVEQVQYFSIYDRWGNLVYEAKAFLPNDSSIFWASRFDNVKVKPGLYTWLAKILFIDGDVLYYNGQVTLID